MRIIAFTSFRQVASGSNLPTLPAREFSAVEDRHTTKSKKEKENHRR